MLVDGKLPRHPRSWSSLEGGSQEPGLGTAKERVSVNLSQLFSYPSYGYMVSMGQHIFPTLLDFTG